MLVKAFLIFYNNFSLVHCQLWFCTERTKCFIINWNTLITEICHFGYVHMHVNACASIWNDGKFGDPNKLFCSYFHIHTHSQAHSHTSNVFSVRFFSENCEILNYLEKRTSLFRHNYPCVLISFCNRILYDSFAWCTDESKYVWYRHQTWRKIKHSNVNRFTSDYFVRFFFIFSFSSPKSVWVYRRVRLRIFLPILHLDFFFFFLLSLSLFHIH